MAKYKADHRDIFFNLLDVLNVTQYEQYGMDESSIKEIVTEYDKFVENEIFPTRAPGDVEGVKLKDGSVTTPESFKKVNKDFYEMGWYALGQPEKWGGAPCPEALSSLCLSLSTGANTAFSMYPGLSKGAMNVIKMVGDEWAQNTFIPPMIEGRWGGRMNLTEAGAGSDVGALKTTATPVEGKEGVYKIKGSKIFISSGDNDLYENIIHLVLARTPGAPEGTKGLSLFITPKIKVNEDGSLGESNDVVCSQVEHKMGIHASATCVLNYGDSGNCEGHLIGKEGEGIQNMFIMMNEARLDCGIQGEAQANLAYMMTDQFVKERVQFKTEIINHPDVRRMMLKMRSMSRGMRSLILYTSDLFDKAKTDKKYESYIGLLTPICKSFCSEKGFEVAVEAVQCHGGYGYCHEYGVEQFVRDTKIATIYEGTNGIQALDFVMRKILKDGGRALRCLSEEIFKTSNQLDDDFSFERGVFTKVLGHAQDAMGFIGKKAKKNEMNYVLQNCKDFLDMAGHIVVAWRLMESAMIAKDKLESAQGNDEKAFLKTKIDDFRIYCAHFLPQASAHARTITGFEDDILTYQV